MRRRALLRALGVAAVATLTMAHVGSPDTWFEGQAGPYPVQVVVRLPGVVPGLGQIDITVPADDVRRVTAQPVIFNAGPEGAPPPDVATPVPGQPQTYHAELWFMEQASYRVRIEVTGAQGSGTVDVPIVAAALQQTPLASWLGGVLLLAGGFLFIGAVTIVRAGATDAITPPTATATGSRTGVIAPIAGAAVLALMLWGGWQWWQAVDREYRDGLYRRVAASALVDTTGGARVLAFTVADSNWMVQRIGRQLLESPIIADHGKLMHLFVIERTSDARAPHRFGHFHPVTTDSLTFRTALGRLPAGRYDLYADVVHETGLPQTLVATVDLPSPIAGDAELLADEADAIFTGAVSGDRFALSDGGSVTWEARPDTLRAGADARLRFRVQEPDGSVARLAPYLGMAGHAVVQRTDGAVYIHLHPNGTVSMGAQQALAARRPEDTLPGMVAQRLSTGPADHGEHAMHEMTSATAGPAFDGTLVFPYAFPEPGAYRVWVQFTREGRVAIETVVFDALVR